MTTDEKTAYETLETAIVALAHAIDPTGDDKDLPVDAVLIVGFQKIDDDGQRCGSTAIFPRHGSQPAYITRGLLQTATQLLQATSLESDDH